MDSVREMALSLHDLGFSVLAVGNDKAPLASWLHNAERWKNSGQTRDEVETMFDGGSYGIGVLCSPYSDLVGLDLDGPHSPNIVIAAGVQIPDTTIDQTPSQGHHYLFRLPPDCPDLQKHTRLLKEASPCGWRKGCGVDFIVGNSYLISSPTPGYKSVGLPIDQRAVLPQQIIDLLSQKSSTSSNDGASRDPSWVQDAHKGPIREGERNSIAVSLAGYYVRLGLDVREVENILYPWSQAICDPAMDQREWGKVSQAILRFYREEKQKRREQSDEFFSHDWAALRFSQGKGRSFRYCSPHRSWYRYDGRAWVRDETLDVVRAATELSDELLVEARDEKDRSRKKALLETAIKSESRSFVEGMLHFAKARLAISPKDFDRCPWSWNCESGVVDLRSGDIRDHDPDDMITKLSPVVYDPSARCPKFLAFLREIFPGYQGLQKIAFLRRFFGYSMTGDISEHLFTILWGVGANGKSTLVSVLSQVWGPYMATAAPDLFIKRKDSGTRHEEAVAFLKGSRLAVVVETARSQVLDTARIKSHSGGDTVTSRKLYQDREAYRPTYTIAWVTNDRPIVKESSVAIWRRIALLNFEIVIPAGKRIVKLDESFADELPGIMAFFMKGSRLWWETLRRRGRGLLIPRVVREDVKEYRKESDIILRFLDARCVFEMGQEVTRSQLNRELKAYATTVGLRWSPSPKEVARHLDSIPEIRGVKRDGVRLWQGLGLLEHGKIREDEG